MSAPETSESTRRESAEKIVEAAPTGEARAPAVDSEEINRRAATRIAQANGELQSKAADLMALPIAMLAEQRDRAIAELEYSRAEAERQRNGLLEEQDAFITFLMAEHEAKVAELTDQLKAASSQVKRLGALQPASSAGAEVKEAKAERANVPRPTTPNVERQLADAEQRLAALQEQLQEAYREVDEVRAETNKMVEERDEAVEAAERLRAEYHDQLQSAREEIYELQRQNDEAGRRLEDARDEARDEMYRVAEQLDTARRELDERRAEVRRLRERLGEGKGEAQRYSQPPPPPGSYELELARDEGKSLRKQLIDTKRELSRLARELEVARGGQSAPRVRVGGDPQKKATNPAFTGVRSVQAPTVSKIPLPLPSSSRTPPGGIGRVTPSPGFVMKPDTEPEGDKKNEKPGDKQ